MKRSEKGNRKLIKLSSIFDGMGEVENKLYQRLEEKGYGAWGSRHEIMGIIGEEYHELQEANHLKDINQMKSELIDIAVGCLFSIACINEDTLDW